ncbi:hypothetical protein D4764_04G0001030 [Takifugu flavidus]|uniref:Uncharacterized protein n=1 Tax=Takifugu flavidus TaxID=433684 RepID=A0A5C6N2J9_9TELE|nr:hypothetical protein D4764_04G0001030 [Takifugu flavidus]
MAAFGSLSIIILIFLLNQNISVSDPDLLVQFWRLTPTQLRTLAQTSGRSRRRNVDADKHDISSASGTPAGSPVITLSPVSALYQPVSALYQPCISLYQPCISLYQPCISLYQPCISLYQPCISLYQPVSGLYQPVSGLYQPVLALYQPPVLALYRPVAALYQPCISPVSACISLYQPCISLYQPVSALYQPCISLYQPCISLYQPCISPVSALYQPCISPISAGCKQAATDALTCQKNDAHPNPSAEVRAPHFGKMQMSFKGMCRGHDCCSAAWRKRAQLPCGCLSRRIRAGDQLDCGVPMEGGRGCSSARLAQSVEHETLNLRVVDTPFIIHGHFLYVRQETSTTPDRSRPLQDLMMQELLWVTSAPTSVSEYKHIQEF